MQTRWMEVRVQQNRRQWMRVGCDPHQGEEQARRRRQIAAGTLKITPA